QGAEALTSIAHHPRRSQRPKPNTEHRTPNTQHPRATAPAGTLPGAAAWGDVRCPAIRRRHRAGVDGGLSAPGAARPVSAAALAGANWRPRLARFRSATGI